MTTTAPGQRPRFFRRVWKWALAGVLVGGVVAVIVLIAPYVEGQLLTLDGSALLATLYPIGVLAGLVEVRAITRKPQVLLSRRLYERFGITIYSRPSAGWIAILTLPAFISILPLTMSVARAEPLKGWSAALTCAAGFLLVGGLTSLVSELILVAIKGEDSSPAPKKPSAGPRPPKSPKSPPIRRKDTKGR